MTGVQQARTTEGGSPAAPLRVLLVSQPTVGGVARCVHQLARAAMEAGIEVTVASPAGGDLPDWVRAEGARWVELPMRRAPGPDDVRRVAALRRLAAGADVVHVHSSKAGALGRIVALTLGRRRVPCVFTPHGWSWLAGGRLLPVYRVFERVAAPLADVIIAVSDGERRAGIEALGRAAGRMVVIENGVDLRQFNPQGAVASRGEEPLLVCVGRLAHQKGQDLAIHALTRLADDRTRLRLVGDGPDRAALERLAAAVGVADRVEFTGTILDPAPHLRAADVVLLPSRWEGLSLTMLEAMACGSAVVSSYVAGSEALRDVGVLVPLEDVTALAAAVDELLADPAERARLGALARRRVEERYALDGSTRATIELWRAVAERRRDLR